MTVSSGPLGSWRDDPCCTSWVELQRCDLDLFRGGCAAAGRLDVRFWLNDQSYFDEAEGPWLMTSDLRPVQRWRGRS